MATRLTESRPFNRVPTESHRIINECYCLVPSYIIHILGLGSIGWGRCNTGN